MWLTASERNNLFILIETVVHYSSFYQTELTYFQPPIITPHEKTPFSPHRTIQYGWIWPA